MDNLRFGAQGVHALDPGMELRGADHTVLQQTPHQSLCHALARQLGAFFVHRLLLHLHARIMCVAVIVLVLVIVVVVVMFVLVEVLLVLGPSLFGGVFQPALIHLGVDCVLCVVAKVPPDRPLRRMTMIFKRGAMPEKKPRYTGAF